MTENITKKSRGMAKLSKSYCIRRVPRLNTVLRAKDISATQSAITVAAIKMILLV